MRRTCSVTLLACLLAACGDHVITDDFGTRSYALISGTVTRQDGHPFAGGQVFASCGESAPGTFDLTAMTDQAGHYQLDLREPVGPPRADAADLFCRLSAGAPPFISDTLPVLFTPTLAARHETIVDLTEAP